MLPTRQDPVLTQPSPLATFAQQADLVAWPTLLDERGELQPTTVLRLGGGCSTVVVPRCWTDTAVEPSVDEALLLLFELTHF